MTDLVERLRNPPRMSVAANRDHLEQLLYELIADGATEIERLRADAERYRWLRYRVCGARDNWGLREFRFPEVPTKGRNIMQGSVAEHLDVAIDEARASVKGET